ncbi:amidohydrolase [Acrocarpospora phusangensis]|uniref:Amidohydrolase n=1 Tax=Acrocarpospora phusangensis TaxID=1070424 RepID=A0A919QA97_9ACTN|nr:amidohydrolase family protein [Acrocarpospora phusangensis]GIH22692.1 amidohydrolase [Acrocarpospora phusangensis]
MSAALHQTDACACTADPEQFLTMLAEYDRARGGSTDPRPLTHPLLWTCSARATHAVVLDVVSGSESAEDETRAAITAAVANDLRRSANPSRDVPAPGDGVTIIANARVFTADPALPWAGALAFRGERIVGVGTEAEVRDRFPDAHLIDVGGRLVVPGLNDAHLHHTPDPVGVRLSTDAQVAQALDPSLDDLDDAIAAARAGTTAPTWLLGTLGLTLSAEPRLDRDHLDRVAGDWPVALLGMTNHLNVFNSAALAALGIDESVPDVLGGFWERDDSGRLNGRVIEYAQWRPQRTLAAMTTIEEGAAAVRAFSDDCLRYGITTVQNMSWTPPERYLEMVAAAAVPLRIRVIDFPAANPDSRDRIPSIADRAALARAAGPRATRSGRKWIIDGTPLELTADFGHPYPGRDVSGFQNFPAAEVDEMLRESVVADDQVLLHAVGTETVRTVIGALERTGGQVDWAARRMRVEHGDGALPEDIHALSRLGAMVVANPSHFLVTAIYTDLIGTGHRISPLRSLVEAGVPVGIGSDGPLNPYLSMFGALVHPTRMSEAVRMEDALRAYTTGGARAEGTDHEKGVIAEGYLADIAVLSQDVFQVTGPALMDTESVLTIIGGQVAWTTLP